MPQGVRGFHWKGGRSKTKHGYITIYLYPDDSYYSMANQSHRVFEHRLVMAKYLNRCLAESEMVHHKNGIRNDNRIENLELTTKGAHSIAHNKGYQDGFKKGYIDGKSRKIKELELYITELKSKIKIE
jgi:hypothetical protein